jgi:hypothetical protein
VDDGEFLMWLRSNGSKNTTDGANISEARSLVEALWRSRLTNG